MCSSVRSKLRIEGRWILALVALFLLGGTSLAGDLGTRPLQGATLARPAIDTARPVVESARSIQPTTSRARESRFDPIARERILPRVSVQLEALTTFRLAAPDRDITDQVMFDELSSEVLRRVEREARRAVKYYLIEVTEVDRLVERLRSRHRAPVDATDPAHRARKLRFDVGFHSLTPEVEMRYGMRQGSFKLSVDARGGLSVQYRDNRMTHTRIVAGFDGDDSYRLHLRIGF